MAVVLTEWLKGDTHSNCDLISMRNLCAIDLFIQVKAILYTNHQVVSVVDEHRACGQPCTSRDALSISAPILIACCDVDHDEDSRVRLIIMIRMQADVHVESELIALIDPFDPLGVVPVEDVIELVETSGFKARRRAQTEVDASIPGRKVAACLSSGDADLRSPSGVEGALRLVRVALQ